MKKIFLFVVSLLVLNTSYAELSNISSTNTSYSVPLLSWATCDEIKTSELYLWHYWVVTDTFVNNSSNSVYLQWASFYSDWWLWTDSSPLCLYNKSLYKAWDYRILNFNKPYLESIWWKINPWVSVRHLTTNQEYGTWWEYWDWIMSGSFINSDLPWNFTFNKANLRNPSNHPALISTWSNYDCQLKIGTIYDSDNNMNTVSDNKMLVECKRYQIRWCWDWVKQTNESCDPNDTSKTWWWVLGCSTSCAPLNPGGWGGGGWSSGWGWSSWWSAGSWGWSSSYCWDWWLQRPNSKAQFEECDFGSTTNWPSWCSKTDCKIRWDNTTPSEWGWDSTYPSEKDGLVFYPAGWAILWNNMWLFVTYNLEKPYIKNNTGYDLYIEKPLCLYKENKSSLIGSSTVCSSSNIWELKNGAKFQISTRDYIAKTSNISWAYETVKLFTAPEWLQTSYLSSTLKVIVAKSSPATLAWGTSLLNYDYTKYSDIDTISQNFLTDLRNKNFIVTSLSESSWFSSYVNKLVDKSVYDSSISEWNDTSAKISANSSSYPMTLYSLPQEKYNGLSNVYVHNWDVILNGQSIVWWKTYLIENGNLYINWNVNLVSWNIAFVVKWGNIIIANNVTGLEWVYLSIWWKIMSDGQKTNNRLLVNGWLYWDASDLFANRTYMKSDNWIINVWTIVNFKSSVFDNPPPLLTNFVEEYMKVAKIAK